MERARPLPGRRRILKGAALAAVPYALLPDARAGAQPRTVDYPLAEWQPATASNYTASHRPATHVVDRVVIHVTQTDYGKALSILQNPRTKVSAHYVVRSVDGHAAQCVRESDVAWHAGNWDYNTRSVGIEHEGWGDRPEYTKCQAPITPIPVRTGTGAATCGSSTLPDANRTGTGTGRPGFG